MNSYGMRIRLFTLLFSYFWSLGDGREASKTPKLRFINSGARLTLSGGESKQYQTTAKTSIW